MKFLLMVGLWTGLSSAYAFSNVTLYPESLLILEGPQEAACYDGRCRIFSTFLAVACDYEGQYQQGQQGGDGRYHSDVEYRRYVTLESYEAAEIAFTHNDLKQGEVKSLRTKDGLVTFKCKKFQGND